jgi:hypothetical protein
MSLDVLFEVLKVDMLDSDELPSIMSDSKDITKDEAIISEKILIENTIIKNKNNCLYELYEWP